MDSSASFDAERRVHEAIDRLEPAYRQFVQALVRVPSVSGQEAEAQSMIAQHMRDIGLIVDSFDVDPRTLRSRRGFNPSSRPYAGR